MYQYPHSVPLVLLAELGVVGCGLFAIFLWSVGGPLFARVVQCLRPLSGRTRPAWSASTTLLGAALLLGVATPFLVDHFLWTTQQGRILLWGILGAVAGSGRTHARTTDDPRA